MYTYLILNIVIFLSTFVLSFEKRISFYKKWKSLFPAIFITGLLFIIWDSIFTQNGVWGFSEEYLTGIKISNLPIEEVLFFITVPYSCMFIYEVVKYFRKEDSNYLRLYKPMTILSFISFGFGIINLDKTYTSITFMILGILILFVIFFFKPRYFGQFILTFFISLIPFLIVNSILTYGLPSISENPIVWYNNLYNVEIRIGTIPIEDFFYSLILIMGNYLIFEKLSERNKS